MSKSFVVFLSSLKMTLATFCSRILGLVREQVMAIYFGASGYTDAFLVAYRIPNLLRDLFAEGAFSSAFVPTFVEQNNISKEKAKQLFWSLFILLGLTTLFFSGFIFFFAHEIVGLFAPSFKEDPEKFLITVNLTKIMAPFLCFVSLAALMMGVLNSIKIFFIPALAPAFFNVTMITTMLILPAYFIKEGIPAIYALGVGVFIGGLVQAFVQVPLIIKNGFGPTKPEKIMSAESTHVVKLLGPGLVGFAATQINLLVTTILASGTVVGAVSWLSYAFRLFQLPVGILSVSIGNSNLVHFSQAWKTGEKDEAKELLIGSFFLSNLFVFAPMIGMYVFAEEIVNLIFERGKFDYISTINTAKALKWYAFGLPFYGIYKILVPTFYALGRQKIPVYSSIFSVAFNIIFCILLTPTYGFEVLALGTSLSMLFNASIQTFILKSDLELSWSRIFNLRFFKLVLATTLTFFMGYFLKDLVVFHDLNFIMKVLYLSLDLLVVASCYALIVFFLGERSAVLHMVNKIKSKFIKK